MQRSINNYFSFLSDVRDVVGSTPNEGEIGCYFVLVSLLNAQQQQQLREDKIVNSGGVRKLEMQQAAAIQDGCLCSSNIITCNGALPAPGPDCQVLARVDSNWNSILTQS